MTTKSVHLSPLSATKYNVCRMTDKDDSGLNIVVNGNEAFRC